jgi:hypothetical protein
MWTTFSLKPESLQFIHPHNFVLKITELHATGIIKLPDSLWQIVTRPFILKSLDIKREGDDVMCMELIYRANKYFCSTMNFSFDLPPHQKLSILLVTNEDTMFRYALFT